MGRTGIGWICCVFLAAWLGSPPASAVALRLPATGITTCYDATSAIPCPPTGEPYYGQDATYRKGHPMTYRDNGDGTVADLVTGLTWLKVATVSSTTWQQAADFCDGLVQGEYSDWRLPTMQELLSLVAWNKTSGPRLATIFANSQGDYVASSICSGDSVANDTAAYWYVDYTFGAPRTGAKVPTGTFAAGVRCVRGTALLP